MKSRSMSCAVGGISVIHLSHVQFEYVRRGKYYIYVWYEIQSPKEMARVMSTEMMRDRG